MKQLSMHVTDLCNSHCGFCVVGSPLARRDSVVYADLMAFLIENAGAGYESVNFHGGEPTTHPRLLDLLDAACTLGYPEIQIQTNGRRLAELDYVAALAERRVGLLVISLHGASAATQDLLTQAPGGFDETILGIRNAKAAGLAVRTNTVLTQQNKNELADICALCMVLDVDHVNISNLHPVGSGFFALDSQAPTAAETRAVLQPAVEALLVAGRRVTLEGFPLCVISPFDRLAVEDGTRQIKMLYQGQIFESYDAFMDSDCRSYGPPCEGCELRARCGGVYNEYTERRGWDEFGLRTFMAAAT